MITLYSYLAGENLARLFQIAGYNVSEERINEGLKLIAVAVTTGVEGYVKDEAGRPVKGVSVIALSKVALIGKVSETTTDEIKSLGKWEARSASRSG
jgi:hypothetical protein